MKLRHIVLALSAALTVGCAQLNIEDFAVPRGENSARLPLALEIDTRSLLLALGEGHYQLSARVPPYVGELLVDQSIELRNELAGRTEAELQRDVDVQLFARWVNASSFISAESETWTERTFWRPTLDPSLIVRNTALARDEQITFTTTWVGALYEAGRRSAQNVSSVREFALREAPAVSDARALIQAATAPLLRPSAAAGTLRVRLVRRKDHEAERAWLIPSVLTLGVINLFGAPLGSQHCELELSLEVLDAQGEVLESYSARGQGSAHAAAYWGYDTSLPGTAGSSDDLSRAAIARATVDALEHALVELRQDIPGLRDALQP
ncbi:MAG: hypothetical protein DHS20C15_24000 [Planctomycetota bacterium]|nr:MAG: hypothetical protein DHS20C15_24000 [Planctomycetota bacterium]